MNIISKPFITMELKLNRQNVFEAD